MRLRYIDIAKGIGILAIVVGHLGIWNAAGEEVSGNWIYSFHVPIFFIIAGYFMTNKRSFKEFAANKAHRLLLPYLVTCLTIFVIVAALLLVRGDAWPSRFKELPSFFMAAFYGTGSWFVKTFFGATPIGPIWFLFALFFASFLQRFALKFKHGWLFNLLWTLIAYITQKYFWLPFSLQSAALGALFMSFGHYLHKHDFFTFITNNKRVSVLIFIACFAVFIVSGIFNLRISVSSFITRTSPLVSIFVACASCIFILLLSKWIDEHCEPVARFLNFYGKNSLVVLCVHTVIQMFSFAILLSSFFGLSENVCSFVNLIIQLAIFTGCIFAFKRVKLLNWIFY